MDYNYQNYNYYNYPNDVSGQFGLRDKIDQAVKYIVTNGSIPDSLFNDIEKEIKDHFRLVQRRILKLILSPVVFVTYDEDMKLKGKQDFNGKILDMNKEHPNFAKPFYRYSNAGIEVIKLSDKKVMPLDANWAMHFKELYKYNRYKGPVELYVRGSILQEDVELLFDTL